MPIWNSHVCATPLRQGAIVALCVILLSGIVSGQATGGSDPLGLPGPVIMCRQMPTTPADSAAFGFQFMDGNGSDEQRTSFAAFDAEGKPLYMMVYAPGQDARGEQAKHIVVVRFFPKGTGEWAVIPNGLTSQAPPVGGADSLSRAKTPEKELTDSEIAHARVLAGWFWAHRCMTSADGQ
jgi:hypothetical protein